jgi:hypothetical protein
VQSEAVISTPSEPQDQTDGGVVRQVQTALDVQLPDGLGVTRDGSRIADLHEFFGAYFRGGEPGVLAPSTSLPNVSGASTAVPDGYGPEPRVHYVFVCERGGQASTLHDGLCRFFVNPTIRPLGLSGGVSPPSVDWLLRNVFKVREPHTAVTSAIFHSLHVPMDSFLLAVSLQLRPRARRIFRPRGPSPAGGAAEQTAPAPVDDDEDERLKPLYLPGI